MKKLQKIIISIILSTNAFSQQMPIHSMYLDNNFLDLFT